VTSGRSGGPSRDADAPTRTTWTLDGIGAIVAVLALGLVFRFIIAQLNPGSGFGNDLTSFQFWASNLATQGFHGFYERDFFHDYTPGYLYVLYLVGLVGNATGNIGDLIKIPPILADVALGWLVWSMVQEAGGSRRAALVGAGLVVFNPVSWYDSVLWGQVDSFGVVFLLLGVRALWRDRPERAAVHTVIAALIKPQLAILVPIVAILTIRRALWPIDATTSATAGAPSPADGQPGMGRADRPGLLDQLRDWERRTGHPLRILTTGLAGFLTAVVLCFPFGLALVQVGNDVPAKPNLVFEMFKTAGEYPYASVNAYNPWALASIDGSGLAANGTWACDTPIPNPPPGGTFCPDAVMIGPIPAVYVGAGLMLAAFLIVALLVAWRPTKLSILVGVTILAIAFFMLPTRVHERYLFPFIAVGAILAAGSVRWRIAYVVLSLTTFLNMYAVLTEPFYKNPGVTDFLHISDGIRKTEGVTLLVLAAIAATVWAFAQLRPGGLRALDDELANGVELDSAGEDRPDAEDPTARGRSGASREWAGAASGATGSGAAGSGGLPGQGVARAVGSGAAAAALAPARSVLPTWTEAGSFAELGPIGWFRDRLNQRPVRADRSRALDGEPTGRFDKLDAWILVVLVVSILGIRMFRLSEPYQMHFDEVYHARTATEFLQGWRYGIDHEIYEYTHPHVAKYAMAGGLIAWGDDGVNATGNLGVPVLDAAIEPRYDDPDLPGGRAGDRVDVVTGSEVRAYDLVTRELIATIPADKASALAVDASKHQLFIGGSNGSIWTYDLTALDRIRAGRGATPADFQPVQFGSVHGAIKRLFVPDDGSAVIVVTADDKVQTLDPVSSEVLGTVQLDKVADVGPAGTAPTLITAPGAVADPKAAASTIAKILGGTAATYQQRLAGTADQIIVSGITGSAQQTAVQKAIDDGRLAGMSINSLPQVAVADANGLEMVNPGSGDLTATVNVGGAAHGLAMGTVDGPKLYVSVDPDPATDEKGQIAIVAVGGDDAKNGPALVASMEMPGPVTRVAYDDATEMVHVLGRTPDGSAATVYVIEPHARSVYADARLPIEPAAWVMDSARPYPTDDRQEILAFDSSGSIASVDVGQHEFAWRLPGVISGALMAGFLYALARILFRRRTVGLFVAVLCLADGMLFVQSRIGMNDAYVGVFIVAAYTLFAALWTGVWRHRGAFWIGMPVIGLLLGLALASKWVGLYAILGIGFLILVRSALGRLLAILSLVAMSAVLGYLAINVPQGTGFGNLPFVALIVALTVAAVVANVLHPLRWSLDEIRFAVGGPVAAGGLGALALIATNHAFKTATIAAGAVGAAAADVAPTASSPIPFSLPMEIAITLIVLGPLVWVAFAVAARVGFGPFAPPPDPDEPAALLPAPSSPPDAPWLRLGAQLGLPAVWMIGTLLVLPVAVYVASYIPWAVIDNHVLFPGWPAGHTGQTLVSLTVDMYNYHNGLTAGHPASSPWWAWLFDFKPVWFYQQSFAGNTTAAIYDAGNLVVWWLGLPALAFAAWQAFARRSLPLALITIGYAFQWVSWARIDRATFQYHYYTSLPFLILALGYFLAELWHGASWRTWLLARMAAAVAILGPAIFWVLDRPLCGFVGVDKANPNSQACPPVIPQFLLTTQTAALAAIVGIAVLVVVRLFNRLGGDSDGVEREVFIGDRAVSGSTVTLIQLGLTALVAIAATWAVQTFIGDGPLISLDRIPVEPVAIVLGLPVLLIAAFIATARDARRFVIGALVAIVGWFIVVYPNLSALPLPTAIANVYQGVLPTYLFAFQFPVNNVAATVKIDLFGPVPLLLGAAVVFLSVVVGYSAWAWRLSIAERLADERDAADLGPGLPRGAGGGAAGD
jgi:hypothetical protein